MTIPVVRDGCLVPSILKADHIDASDAVEKSILIWKE